MSKQYSSLEDLNTQILIYELLSDVSPKIVGVDYVGKRLQIEYLPCPTLQAVINGGGDVQHLLDCSKSLYRKICTLLEGVSFPSWDPNRYDSMRRNDLEVICAKNPLVPSLLSPKPARQTLMNVHGDFHAENILCGRDKLYGIDYDQTGQRPVAIDIFKLCYNYAMHAPESTRAVVATTMMREYGVSAHEGNYFFTAESIRMLRRVSEFDTRALSESEQVQVMEITTGYSHALITGIFPEIVPESI